MSSGGVPTIVVAVDPGKRPEDPVVLGILLAWLTSAPLSVVTVAPQGPFPRHDDVVRELRDEVEADLRRVLSGLEVPPAAGTRVLRAASPARALQQLSEDPALGLMVIGSTTRGPVRRTLPGSIADRLLSGSASPIAVAPHGFADAPPRGLATLGVAYDGSPEARVALEGARRLARQAGAQLRVITVHQRLAFGNRSTSAVSLATVNATLEGDARRLLEEAVAADGELSVEGWFRIGRPAEVLVAQTRDLDLLMAGSRGYGPLGAVLLGSTTHDLMRLAHCPILITPRGRELTLAQA